MGTLKTLTKTALNVAISPIGYIKGAANETAERIENTENATLIALRDRKVKEQWAVARELGHGHAKWANDKVESGVVATIDAIMDIVTDSDTKKKGDDVACPDWMK